MRGSIAWMAELQDVTPERIAADAAATVLDYHRRTRHRFDAYALGPSALDWDAQPAPFRHFDGAPSIALPLVADGKQHRALAPLLNRPFGAPAPFAAAIGLSAIGALLNLALGITAWKTLGPDRWAVRANPSSGNLHPIEAYVIAVGIGDLADGIYHYDPLQHTLSQRAKFGSHSLAQGSLFVGLTSVMWRETWKYGERAFRYCALDCGHAMSALAYAAKVLNWSVCERRDITSESLAALLGIDRALDFPGRPATEREEAEVLLQFGCSGARLPGTAQQLMDAVAESQWFGRASAIDRFPMFRWPIVEHVAEATRRSEPQPPQSLDWLAPITAGRVDERACSDVILQRRSALRFDTTYRMPWHSFRALLGGLLPEGHGSRITLVFFVQRVDGLLPGIYFLPRGDLQRVQFFSALHDAVGSSHVADLPGLYPLVKTIVDVQAFKRLLRSLHCHQDIASGACFAVGMLAPLDAAVTADPASYRDLLREAGAIGQSLYLHAEVLGLRGTGVGCYFDEPVLDTLELNFNSRDLNAHEINAREINSRDAAGSGYQSLYHFTIGLPLPDPRMATAPPYPERTG